ncbi:DUF5712 family protein [Dyadobacter sediminis]|uniref:Mobilization protein n=1 Tax=Dyadobacter sediminis TaxID=1493691 RepID=A0A5R9KGL3_9BACT|nr:DUF5712 family protein [Dyadobacter sediminis]TLU95322.1 hypothetical protein FEM55_07270 [Dyadobacter sediminis]GGC16199.1 clindamycin resistance transfer factor BtgB [Dyadobacter sediminis]
MAHVNITASETGGNTGSCGQLTDYLEKENQKLNKKELWFDQGRDDIGPDQVKSGIDQNVAKLKKTEAKFYLINISPSGKELDHIGNDPQKLKAFAREVMKEYAENFNKGLSEKDIKYYGKIEYHRYYTHEDQEVKQGLRQRGEAKEGSHMHAQLIVSRKTADNGRLISPMTNHRGSNASHSKKFGQFNRLDFTERCEKAFDRTFGYVRELSETFQYRKVMLNGTVMQRADMIVAEQSRQLKQAKEHSQAVEQNKREKKELAQQPKITDKQAHQKERGRHLCM